jgi:phosphoribosylanthranilate isomerase
MLQVHGATDTLGAVGVPLIVARTLQDAQNTTATGDGVWLLDAHDPVRHGGTGRVIDWLAAARVAATRRVLLAGGLTPANVGDAIAAVRPWGVDVASGVEASPGRKRRDLLEQFVAAVRAADTNGRGTGTGTHPEGARA